MLSASIVILTMLSIVAYGLDVLFISAPSVGIAPYTAVFQVSPTGENPPFQYTWDFSDGQTTNTSATFVQHVYSNPGTYTPVVTVFDRLGFSASATNEIQILAPYAIINCTPSNSNFVIEWVLPFPTGQHSIVQQTTNLIETPFTNLAKIPYPTFSYTDTVHRAQLMRFYRVIPLPE